MHLSFVLLDRPYDVDGAAVLASYARLFPQHVRPLVASCDGSTGDLRWPDGRSTIIAIMPAPVPNGEADSAAALSLAALSSGGAPSAAHAAHLTVASLGDDATVESLLAHTRLVAACVDAYRAVAVYEGNAGATHPARFYVDVVTSVEVPVMVWTGVSVARPSAARIEFLTLGMETNVGVPDMLLSARTSEGNEPLLYLFDLLTYVLQRGVAIPEGNTVGRTAREKIPVRYVPSPIDPSRKVARVDLP